MLNIYEKRALRNALHEVRDMPKISDTPGICDSLTGVLGSATKQRRYCEKIWQEWPHYSGRTALPVPGEYIYPLWTGTAGELRYDLLDFLITRLSADIAETEAEDAACGHDEFPLPELRSRTPSPERSELILAEHPEIRSGKPGARSTKHETRSEAGGE